MDHTYCGACRGERGCIGCKSVGRYTEYVGLTEFYADGTIQSRVRGERNAEQGHNCSSVDGGLVLAADLGTTTLAFVCADEKGEVLASYSCGNPQRKVAADVIGRIDAAMHGQGEILTSRIREALVKGFLFVLTRGEATLARRGRIKDADCIKIGIAGNTVMQHLLCGYSTEGMQKAPFTPYTTDRADFVFSELFSETTGYSELPEVLKPARVTVFPGISAFVGGDAVAGANMLLPRTGEQVELMVDMGTNGEMILSAKGKWYGTAAAMGCAFEGGRYAYASELFRLIAAALKQGVVDETGLLCEPFFSDGYEGLQQQDIREFQLAKGALRAGIECLCNYAKVRPEQVERVWIAGGIGKYCETEDFLRTGLLPKAFCGKIQVVGNACIGGIVSCLSNGEDMIYCEGESLNLAEQPEFEALYYRHMNFYGDE